MAHVCTDVTSLNRKVVSGLAWPFSVSKSLPVDTPSPTGLREHSGVISSPPAPIRLFGGSYCWALPYFFLIYSGCLACLFTGFSYEQ
jgi:hypothetical protein